MEDSEGRQYHIHCRQGDVGRYVFLPGDPARSSLIAAKFDQHWKVVENREYVTYTGTVDGHKVSVTSTGIGGPSTAIAIEELSRIGADTFIRIGGSGGMQPEVVPGDLVIATASVRDEGTSMWYIPMEYPAVASYDVVSAMIQAAEKLNKKYHVGIVNSKAAFYGQEFNRNEFPSYDFLDNRWKAWIRGGVLAAEMEAAVIFVLASIKRMRGGCILVIGGNQEIVKDIDQYRPMKSIYSKEEAIEVGIESVRILAKWDEEKKKGGG